MVFALCFESEGRGGLLGTLFVADAKPCLSMLSLSANSSNATESSFVVSFRSSVHDFDLCLRLNGSPMKAGIVLLCWSIGSLPFPCLGDRGVPY